MSNKKLSNEAHNPPLRKGVVSGNLPSSSEIAKIENIMYEDLEKCQTPTDLLLFISLYELEPEECEVGYNPNRQNFLRAMITKIYEFAGK